MKVLMLFANGFEDVEAIATRDVLIRAGIEVVDAQIDSYDQTVISSHKMALTGFFDAKCVNPKDYEAIILPGGSRGVQNLLQSKVVDDLVNEFARLDKYLCAICAAPMVLGKLGLLNGKKYTCYPGCNEGLVGEYTGNEVEIDGKLITGRSMLYSIPFGLQIVKILLGKEAKDRVYSGIAGLNKK